MCAASSRGSDLVGNRSLSRRSAEPASPPCPATASPQVGWFQNPRPAPVRARRFRTRGSGVELVGQVNDDGVTWRARPKGLGTASPPPIDACTRIPSLDELVEGRHVERGRHTPCRCSSGWSEGSREEGRPKKGHGPGLAGVYGRPGSVGVPSAHDVDHHDHLADGGVASLSPARGRRGLAHAGRATEHMDRVAG
jgi:hypothetical protein